MLDYGNGGSLARGFVPFLKDRVDLGAKRGLAAGLGE